MLKNFNKLVKSVIFESIENDDDEKRIREVYHCNEFFLPQHFDKIGNLLCLLLFVIIKNSSFYAGPIY